METKILKLEHNKTNTTPCYGGSTTIVEYTLSTTCENEINTYEVKAEIRGIATGDLYLNVIEVTPLTNNSNTLTSEGVIDLLDW